MHLISRGSSLKRPNCFGVVLRIMVAAVFAFRFGLTLGLGLDFPFGLARAEEGILRFGILGLYDVLSSSSVYWGSLVWLEDEVERPLLLAISECELAMFVFPERILGAPGSPRIMRRIGLTSEIDCGQCQCWWIFRSSFFVTKLKFVPLLPWKIECIRGQDFSANDSPKELPRQMNWL